MRYLIPMLIPLQLTVSAAWGQVIVEDVIDITRYRTEGSIDALTYDPVRQELVFPSGYEAFFPTPANMVAIDLDGALVREWPLSRFMFGEVAIAAVYGLGYDELTDGFFAGTVRGEVGNAVYHLVQTTLNGDSVVSETQMPDGSGGFGLFVEDNSLWTTETNPDYIRQYSRSGELQMTLPLDLEFGPRGIARSFDGGFFLTDHFGRRIVHVDSSGKYLGAIATEGFGGGRPGAIATDLDSQLSFVMLENSRIVVLRGVPEPKSVTLISIGMLLLVRDGSLSQRRRGKARDGEQNGFCASIPDALAECLQA